MESEKTNGSGPIAGRKEVLFDGHFYDVTDFVKRHPGNVLEKLEIKNCVIRLISIGGSIIEYYTKSGEDATHAIQQFHQRSTKRVKAIMSSLKSRPAADDEGNYGAQRIRGRT